MKIVIDARMLGWTGVGRYTQRLLENLENIDQKHDYIVLMLKKDISIWSPTAKNFRPQIVNILPYSFAEQLKLYGVLMRIKPDLVHFPAPNTPLLYRGRRICTIHDLTLVDYKNIHGNQSLLYEIKYQAFKAIIMNAAKYSTCIITDTNFIAKVISGRFNVPRSRITAIPLGSELISTASTPYAPMKDKNYLLYVGNAYPYKNLARLCDAFIKLNQPAISLVLVGKKDYFYTELQKYIDQRGYTNIHLTGFVSNEQLVWLYKNSQAYIFPSLSEGFGLPGLEAMSYGVPVASANATCLPEVYSDAAIYFDPKDTGDMIRVLKELVASKSTQATLRKKGLARVKRFSWRKMAEQTLGVYEKALRS